MESELSPDKVLRSPSVPLKTYQWEDLRRARKVGAYPWTHLLKPPLEGEVTAEDIIRETTPRRSMSRDVSRSRTHTPDHDTQKILHLDSSPGSSRRHGDEGEDEGVQIPNFSKEVSLDSEDDAINQAVKEYMSNQGTSKLTTPLELPKNVSPKSILKRRTPDPQLIPVSETREKSKCCHPLVNKIKHLADKTLHKLEKSDGDKSPLSKRKKDVDSQEIRQLKSSPGAIRRQKFSAIKLGDSDEMSKTMSVDTPPSRKKKEHIYEDIEESNLQDTEKCLQFSQDTCERNMDKKNNNNENENTTENKSIASHDPSLINEENSHDLRPEEHVMEKLHKMEDIDKEALVLDFDNEEPNIDEIFQNQLEEVEDKESPNITITEIIDEETEEITEEVILRQPSQSPCAESFHGDINWSKPNSDHEYEVIEKPPPEIICTAPSVEDKPVLQRKEDELSSTTSLERKYLQHTSDEEENIDQVSDLKYSDTLDAEALQPDIEDRYFVSTPSTESRTECEISTSQVDSSALENLPLKRENRTKSNGENSDNKFQIKIREGTDKIKSHAGKLKTKLQSMTTKQVNTTEKPNPKKADKSKFKLPDRPKFSFPDRPKFTLPERPKFTLPDRRKFSLPDRPKFKKINISEKLSLGDRKKFTFPERPKFNVPDLSKFKFPERPKVNFPSFSRKKEYKVDNDILESKTNLRQVATLEFETKTYPRLFKRKKKSDVKTSSSPTLDREETPTPIFTFVRVGKEHKSAPMYRSDSPAEPREYGNIEDSSNMEAKNVDICTYDFDKIVDNANDIIEDYPKKLIEIENAISTPDISPSNQEYTHVINEINNDEFFVRPKGISRENIQVREYLSDEIRQAFKIPKNALALMGGKSEENDEPLYANKAEADPELYIDENEPIRYSNEDLNERDDGYYTFPPVRPNRAKRKKKDAESVKYIDESYNTSMQLSEVDLGTLEDRNEQSGMDGVVDVGIDFINKKEYYINNNILSQDMLDDMTLDYLEQVPIQSQTLPSAPKRKKRNSKKNYKHSSLSDFNSIDHAKKFEIESTNHVEDIIVYRTEHEYIVPEQDFGVTQQSPVPPRRSRNRSRSSHGTSLCDDDRTSQGAESLLLDTRMSPTDDADFNRSMRHESPGYATVDKGGYTSNNIDRKSKTPPARRRKSHSSERKYYTVGPTKECAPERPSRKKSATSLMTLDSITKRSASGDLTQYVEIDDPHFEEVHKDLKSGDIVSKMKDRPLPPPPRPPRNPTRKKVSKDNDILLLQQEPHQTDIEHNTEVVEIEVSTQTDPLPDDVDYELGFEENIDFSMSSSLRDIADADSICKSLNKLVESPRQSRPVSRSDKSIKVSDPKIVELSKPNIGRTSPTVILVERRVSSPTRINEHEEMLTEASLTVQHIDVDESVVPVVPPLPKSRSLSTTAAPISRDVVPASNNCMLEKINDFGKDVQLDNLVTQRLHVKDLDVGRLNVSELQASKILVSDIEGMTLQVAELDSKSGHISVSGIEFSQTIIDEIVKKFSELAPHSNATGERNTEIQRPKSREEETQTEESQPIIIDEQQPSTSTAAEEPIGPTSNLSKCAADESMDPPQRPPPPDLTPLLYSYLQDLSMPPASFYHLRTQRDRPFTEFHESQQSPPPPRRSKRKPAPHNESSSDDSHPRPSPRRMPLPVKVPEQTISEAGAHFLRVCHNSICNTARHLFNSMMSYIGGTEDKKDLQMALVIFLVLIAGLIMFGLSDSRTIHHHHWEFFNPPDGKK